MENDAVDVVRNGCGHCGHRTLKLTVSKEGINGISLFLTCWYKFKKARSYRNNYRMGMVKNGDDLLGHGTLKSAVSEK